ncbi:MAG: hypothetical protein IKB46_06295 [Paludibacteraceae bacterium]|nr:hypothetical protein [Paludibacteraceae bacterium]
MKKITLLSAVLVAGMATAQVQMTALENMEVRQVVATQSVEMDREITMEEWNAEYIAKQQKAAAEDYAAHDYYYVDGMMHWGLTPTFMGLAVDLIAIPYMESVVWKNLYGPTDWYDQYDDALLAEDSETLVAEGWYGIDGVGYYLPYTTDHTLTQNGVDYLIKGYKFAAGNENGGLLASGAAPFTISTGENIPITLCGMATDPMNNDNGSDFYRIGAGVRGAYAYGTKLIADTATGATADTLLSTVRNVSPLNISSINIPLYNVNGTTMIPENAEIKIEIFAADLNSGIIYTDSILGTTVATVENFLEIQAGLGTLVATFQEEDPFGGMMDVSVVVEGDFVVQLTGFNESGCDFGIYADYYTPGGTTVYCVNGTYTPIFSASSNLAIMYDAYWPTVQDAAGNVMNVSVEGGEAYYVEEGNTYTLLYTNVYDVDALWSVDYPEWMEVEYFLANIGTEEAPEPVVAVAVTVEPLTEGTGRQGVVTFDADGYVYELVVNQGEVVNTGVENVVAPSFSGKTYNLLGVEVDENYKGIVIKNGKKTIQ